MDLTNIIDIIKYGSLANKEKAMQEQAEIEKRYQENKKEMEKQMQEAGKSEQEIQDRVWKEQSQQTKLQKEKLSLIEKLAKLFEPKQENAKEGEPSPTPTPNPIIEALKKGFENYSLKSGYDNPLATMSAEMAKAGEENPLPDPYLPAVMNLMETSGSKNMAQDNNYFNWGTNPKPDAQTAINQVYQGIGNTGEGALYSDYLQTGNIGDFFKKYTPSSDPRNPDQQTLIDTYNSLRRYFPSTI